MGKPDFLQGKIKHRGSNSITKHYALYNIHLNHSLKYKQLLHQRGNIKYLLKYLIFAEFLVYTNDYSKN